MRKNINKRGTTQGTQVTQVANHKGNFMANPLSTVNSNRQQAIAKCQVEATLFAADALE